MQHTAFVQRLLGLRRARARTSVRAQLQGSECLRGLPPSGGVPALVPAQFYGRLQRARARARARALCRCQQLAH
eukprot:2643536-Alexandrium_andersonii.AAC.1